MRAFFFKIIQDKIKSEESESLAKISLSKNKNYWIGGEISVFNISDLHKIVSLSPKARIEEIILQLYLKYGINGFNQLHGEYNFVLYDTFAKELIIVRNPTNDKKIYYYIKDNIIIVSTNLKKIINDNNTTAIFNEKRLIEDLADVGYKSNQTYYQNIFVLRKAEYILIQNYQIKTREKYYTIPQKTIYYKNKQDYFDAYEELMKKAIQNRIQNENKIGLMLSSGMDSTAIAYALNKDFNNKELLSYTHAPQYKVYKKNKLTDESFLVQEILKVLKNIKGKIVRSENKSILEPLYRSLELHPEPMRNVGNAFWIFDILDKAYTENINTLLIGQAGNATISWPTLGYINGYYNLVNKIKKLISNPLLAFRYIKDTTNWETNSIYTPYIEEQIKILKKEKQYDAPKQKYRETLFFSENISPYDNCKVQIKDPTRDLFLMEYMFNLPKYFYTEYNNRFIKQYLNNKIPQRVINNSSKGLQSSDFLIRLKKEEYIVQKIIGKIKDSRCEKYYNISENIKLDKKNLRDLQKILYLCFQK